MNVRKSVIWLGRYMFDKVKKPNRKRRINDLLSYIEMCAIQSRDDVILFNNQYTVGDPVSYEPELVILYRVNKIRKEIDKNQLKQAKKQLQDLMAYLKEVEKEFV